MSGSYLYLFMILSVCAVHKSDTTNLYWASNDRLHVKVLLVPGMQLAVNMSPFIFVCLVGVQSGVCGVFFFCCLGCFSNV